MEFTNKAELVTFLTDLQGQLANLQETVDKLAPVEGEGGDEKTDPLADETPPPADEVDELDSLLQED